MIAGDLLTVIDRGLTPLVPVVIVITSRQQQQQRSIPMLLRLQQEILIRIKHILERGMKQTKINTWVPADGYIATLLPREDILTLDPDTRSDHIHIYLDHQVSVPEISPDLLHMVFGLALERLGSLRDDIRSLFMAKLYGDTVSSSPSALASATNFISTDQVLELLGIKTLHEAGITGQGVNLAIVDTGATPLIFNRHAQTKANQNPVTYIGAQTTGIYTSSDTNGHGSHVFTIAAGYPGVTDESGSKVRVAGVAPDSKRAIIKVLATPLGMGSDSTVIAGIKKAIDEFHADVINLSLGSSDGTAETSALIQFIESYKESNVIFVAAAGNAGVNRVSSPASAENVIAIGAYDTFTARVASFSNRGEGLDFIMPGVRILSGIQHGTLLDRAGKAGSGYAILSGTSMATPFASGLIALAKQVTRAKLGRELTWRDVIQAGRMYGETWSPDRGYGLLTATMMLGLSS